MPAGLNLSSKQKSLFGARYLAKVCLQQQLVSQSRIRFEYGLATADADLCVAAASLSK
jgi:hypothetical protein